MPRSNHPDRRWTATVLVIAVTFGLIAGTGHLEASASETLEPAADSYVDSTRPDRNFGTSNQLRIDGDPERIGYIRFQLPEGSSDTTAALRIHSLSSGEGFDVHAVADDTWSETEITFDNAPAVGALLGSTGAVESGVWYTVDVSEAISETGSVSLAITTADDTALKISSREGSDPPQLLVPAPGSPSPWLVTRDGSNYTATSQSEDLVHTGTLKSVVEVAVVDLRPYGGGVVEFAADTFDLGGDHFELDDVEGVTFVGQGIGQTTITNHSDASTDTEIFDLVGAQSVVIADMSLAAGGPVRSTSDAVDFDNGNDSSVIRVEVTASRGRGIVFDGKGTGWSAEGNRVEDCIIGPIPGDGIELLAASNNSVTGCSITEVQGHGIQINKASSVADTPNKQSSGNAISDNVIIASGQDGININSGDLNQIVGNHITNSSQVSSNRDGIRIDSFDGVSCNDNFVDSNIATDDQPTKTQAYGLNIADGECHRTDVRSSNDFSGNLKGDIRDLGTDTIYEPDTTPPTVPTGVTATALSHSAVQISWDGSSDDTGVAGYSVYRDGSEVGTVDGATTSFEDTGLTAETTYSYTVDAFDAAGNRSDQSSPPAEVTTPPPDSTDTSAPRDDAYVDESNPDSNFGTSTQLRVDASPDVRSYLTFDVSGSPGVVVSAQLRIRAGSSLPAGFEVRTVADTGWDEGSITYQNAPPVGEVVATSGPVTGGEYVEIDVTSHIPGDGTYSFALTPLSTTNLRLDSKESANPPELALEYDIGNSAPSAGDAAITTDEDSPTVWAPLVDDADGDLLTCAISAPAEHGTATVSSDCSGGTYEPDPDYHGPDTFQYEVSDGSLTDNGTVTVDVTSVNDAPTADDLATSTFGDTPVAVTLSGGDVDGDCPLAFEVVDAPLHGTLGPVTDETCDAGQASAGIEYTPASGFAGEDTFTYRTVDPSASKSEPATVTVVVEEAPTSLTLQAAADAYVNGDAPDTNYGSATSLRVERSPDIRSYLRFDLSSVSGTITSATLRLFAPPHDSTGREHHPPPAGFEVREVTEDWTEGSITYATSPPPGGVLAASGSFSSGTWIEIAVTPVPDGSGNWSIALTPLNATSLQLDSREAGAPPELVVEVES